MTAQTHMRHEILAIPDVIETLLSKGSPAIEDAATDLREVAPSFLITIARGSSDHAATFLKYACELVAGVPVASVGPSIASVYKRKLALSKCASIAISQSGMSPDILSMAEMAKNQGALGISLTNHPDSDLARFSDRSLYLHAGTERSVAATKTFVTSVISSLWLLAKWQKDDALLTAIHQLPDVLNTAARLNWDKLASEIETNKSLYSLGRGPTLAVSNEAALKFKEVCQLHAESYSSAEVLHGPVSIVEKGFPILALSAADEAESSLAQVADGLTEKGARVFATTKQAKCASFLPCTRTGHPLLDPVSLIVSFYAMVEKIARSRGIDPDNPRHLKKVTKTV